MNADKLTVVMYHYVRDLQNSRYPQIKGCDVRLFKEQIKFLQKHYNFVTIEQVINAYRGGIVTNCHLMPCFSLSMMLMPTILNMFSRFWSMSIFKVPSILQ